MATKSKGASSPSNGSYEPHHIERPKTPTTRSRIDEKNALISLNNRLAAILERKSQLEDENSLLSKELVTERENTIQTLSLLQKTYDNELEEVRKQLQDSDKDRARLELNQEKLNKELTDLSNRLDKKTKECKKFADKLAQAEDEIGNLFTGLQKANADRDKLANDKRDLQEEVVRLGKMVDELSNKLEDECMQKIEFQNQMDRHVEDFVVKKQIYEQEIMNIKSHREVEIAEMDGRLKKEYESKLENDIQQLRDEYERQADKNKEAQEALYATKVDDLRSQLNRLKDALADKADELATVTEKLNTTIQKLSLLEGDNYGLVKSIRDLEKKLADDRDYFGKEMRKKDLENDELRADKSKLIQEYQDLWDTKVVLDNEIATYHMLLEGEERRLSQTPTSPKEPELRKTTKQESKSFSKTKTSYTQI